MPAYDNQLAAHSFIQMMHIYIYTTHYCMLLMDDRVCVMCTIVESVCMQMQRWRDVLPWNLTWEELNQRTFCRKASR